MSEATFQAVVDSYADADFFLAVGEEGVEVDEGYMTCPTLPWIDRPLVMYNLLGGSPLDHDTGIKDAGVSVARIIPAGSCSSKGSPTYWPSEFSQVRSQYRRTRYGDDDQIANELLFQVLFTIGAHGAHPF